MDLHPGETVVFDGHPSWRSTISFYFGGALLVAAAAVVIALVWDVLPAVGIGAALLALLALVGLIKRTATDYTVTTQRLYIRRGIIAKHVQQTRIDRVQNVNTSQNLRERLLRIGTVDFDTAGTDDSEFRFEGISNPSRVAEAVDRAQRDAAASRI